MSYKKVTFGKKVIVYLIPYYNELENYRQLWWNNNDINNFKKNAVEDINRLFNIHPNINYENAMRLLYQPNNISYDPKNFC